MNGFGSKLIDMIVEFGCIIFGTLDISNYVNNVSEYHYKIIDKENTIREQIEQIFSDVEAVDTVYMGKMSSQVNYADPIVKFISDLADIIDPSAGNMDVKKMNTLLTASQKKMEDMKPTEEKPIEDEMIGVSAEGAEMSPDPVNLSTGNFVYDHEDIKVGGEIGLSFHRYYNSKDSRIGTLGKCFLHNYEIAIEEKSNGDIGVRLADGQLHHFEKTTEGKYIGKTLAVEDLEKIETGYVLINPGKERRFFNKEGKIIRQENWNNQGISFLYNERMQLVEAVSDTGSKLCYTYDKETSYLILVEDHTGRKVELSYSKGNLDKVVLPLGITYGYKYADNGRIMELVNSRNISSVKNQYDKQHRVTHQIFPDGGMMSFEYDDKNRRVIMTERNGTKVIHVHDERYRNTETIYEDGTSEKFIYNDKNQCISKTDRNGHTRHMAYDNRGNVIQVVDSLKKRVNLTYDAYSNLVSISINGKERLKNFYDAKGNLIGTRNLNGDEIRVSYDKKGLPVEITYPDGGKVNLSYDDRANMVSLVD